MRWEKQGRIFEAQSEKPWMVTHAMTPFALPLGGELIRVFFAGRDASNRTQIGYFDLRMNSTPEVVHVCENPVIGLGELGAFDDSGVNSSWVVRHDGRYYHYYGGRSEGVSVPFYVFVGLAVSDDGGQSFRKFSPAPLLERSLVDPYLTGTPCVLVEGTRWRMWYLSGVRWERTNEGAKHYYHIKYAESNDGIQWRRDGRVVIDFQSPEEYAIARPSVLHHRGVYRMWYSYRGVRYRIGYAESVDGYAWTRMDGCVGIDVSESGWDSEMIGYPHVFDHWGRIYMLYNGNRYGKSGIGLASLVE